jgi:hypothetical protein
MARDPLPAYRGVLISRGVDEEVLDQIDAAAKAAVDLATEEAKAGPEPDLALAFTNVWADGGWTWRSAGPGERPPGTPRGADGAWPASRQAPPRVPALGDNPRNPRVEEERAK